jgi:ketosteroid isomerase-like protein
MLMDPSSSVDDRVAQAIALLRSVLSHRDEPDYEMTPWQEMPVLASPMSGRVSATERLTWWFRPAVAGQDAWDSYFEDVSIPGDPVPKTPARSGAVTRLRDVTAAHDDEKPLGHLADLRLVLADPEEELSDTDADAVVTCLYDFIHAIGCRDIAAAMACVAPDYHTMEGDREVDYAGLAAQLNSLLDGLRDWDIETSLVEIPEPVLYPGSILVYAYVQIEGYKYLTRERQTIVHRRVAVFRQQSDHSWRLAALSVVPS